MDPAWGIILRVGEEMHEHRHAVRQAALAAGWSHRHRDVSGGRLRPTVFGAVDGLVTNTSLIAGQGGGGTPIILMRLRATPPLPPPHPPWAGSPSR